DRAPAELRRFAPALGRVLATRAEPPQSWVIRGAEIALDKPVIIGIVNVTPDSFSDGGQLTSVPAAIDHGARLAEQGARLLDVGGESTRPGAQPVPAKEEIARVVPVIRGLVQRGSGPVSIDTRKAEVARAALDAGAAVVNDVSGLRFDPELAALARDAQAGVILMHMRGTPATMDDLATYNHVAVEVAEELAALAAKATEEGIERDRIVVDPGFGFAKTATHNFRLLDELATVVAVGYPVAVGLSRKRFLGAATGRPVDDRDRATAVACALAWERGARLFRVHDVALTREALELASATTKST
ncbi:MAG TPA: dihydropteroate synthase, partial [Gemmatimonadales bacterium]|nr:dihydropteroate synthase [Gemmatimonadales bacterium]